MKAFVLSLSSLASMCLGDQYPEIQVACIACHSGSYLYDLYQHGISPQAALPLVVLGAESVLSQTALKPLIPYARGLLQTLSSYDMGCDIYRETQKTWSELNSQNCGTAARNLTVYAINALSTSLSLYRSYFPKAVETSISTLSLEDAKKELCAQEPRCIIDTDWSSQKAVDH